MCAGIKLIWSKDMYKVIEFVNEKNYINEFVKLPFKIYKKDLFWIPNFINEEKAILNRRHLLTNFLEQSNFMIKDHDRTVARLITFINPLIKINGSNLGTIGMIEFEEDYDGFEIIIDRAIEWFKERGIRNIQGPMCGSMWMSNRIMTKGFEEKPFLREPYNKPYYVEFFKKYGFKIYKKWISLFLNEEEQIKNILESFKPRYERALRMGYSFRNIDLSNFDRELYLLHELMSDSFSEFTGFNEIDRKSFVKTFRPLKSICKSEHIIFSIAPDSEVVGFTILFPDISKALKLMNGRENVLSKIKFLINRNNYQRVITLYMGIKQKGFKKHLGLGRAQGYLAADYAMKKSKKFVAGLVAEDSLVNAYFSKNELYKREYALYQMILE